MKFCDINVRDPFILVHDGRYYLYGTRAIHTWTDEIKDGYGFDVYESEDLENWSGPFSIFENYQGFYGEFQFWAPEVHEYEGKFYLLATFGNRQRNRGTAILVCDTPNGKFRVHSTGPVTPAEWSCLDGTLYVENGVPYMVFCHEWTQIKNGEVCAVELSKDLKSAVGEPFTIFKATDGCPMVKTIGDENYVTDGPFLMRFGDELVCLWSSYGEGGYIEALARSENGKISGKWTIDSELLMDKDGGHGMLFEDLQGDMNFVYHSPNETPFERPCVRKIDRKALMRH